MAEFDAFCDKGLLEMEAEPARYDDEECLMEEYTVAQFEYLLGKGNWYPNENTASIEESIGLQHVLKCIPVVMIQQGKNTHSGSSVERW